MNTPKKKTLSWRRKRVEHLVIMEKRCKAFIQGAKKDSSPALRKHYKHRLKQILWAMDKHLAKV